MNPLLKATEFKKRLSATLTCLLFFGMAFFMSCSGGKKPNTRNQGTITISDEEKVWMGKFFQDFFWDGPAIYTLFGSKPMSMMTIVTATEEEWIESHKQHWENLEESKKQELLQEIRAHAKSYDLNVNWDKWMTWLKSHPQSNFLFLKHETESKNLFNAIVINTKEVSWILQENYSLFSRTLKMEFDPVEATFDLEKPESIFWSGVFSNALLQGVLFGYGERNAFFFSQEFGGTTNEKHLCFSSTDSANPAEAISENIQIPLFRSYHTPCSEDPVVAKYAAEKGCIETKLRNKHFDEEVLNRIYGASD